MSRQPSPASGAAGQGAEAPYDLHDSGYISVSLDCHTLLSDDVLTGAAQVAILRCGHDYYVAVIEGHGSVKNVYAMYREWTWDRAREVMEELADIYDVCIEFESYDVCLEEEINAGVQLGVVAVACKRGKKRVVAVLELKDGRYRVAKESDNWTWERAIILGAELAEKHGICAGNEFCNKCLQHAINGFAETIMRLAGRV